MNKQFSNSKGALIVCFGPSQLIINIETLKLNGISLSGTKFIYVGIQNDSLDMFFRQVSEFYGIEYVTPHLPTEIIHPLDCVNSFSVKSFLWIFDQERILSDHASKVRSDWTDLQNRITIISLRPFLANDVVLLSILKPLRIILSADGIALNFESRTLSGYKWHGLNSTLKCLPTEESIWCPSYLAKNVSHYGNPSIIPKENISQGYHAIKKLPLVEQMQDWLNTLASQPKSILLSQHFSLSGLMSGFQEINKIISLLEVLNTIKMTPVLIKPHPRDDPYKLKVIEKILSSDQRQLGYLIPKEYAAVPAETLGLCLDGDLLAAIGWTSSALLSLNYFTGCQLILAESSFNGSELNRQMNYFKAYIYEYNTLDCDS